MVLESWESVLGNHSVARFSQGTIRERLWTAWAKTLTTELVNVSRLYNFDEQKVEELLYLLDFGVLEVKDDLDTSKKNR